MTLLRKPFKKVCSSMDSVLVMQIEQNKHLPASVAVVVCMNMLYFHIRLRDADAGVTVIQFEDYNGFKLVTHPNFPCKTVNQWDQLEVVLHFTLEQVSTAHYSDHPPSHIHIDFCLYLFHSKYHHIFFCLSHSVIPCFALDMSLQCLYLM